MADGLLIAGGGLAAQRCCEVLRAAGDDRPITVVCAEPVRPYDRPPLSKELRPGAEAPFFRPQSWYSSHGVTLRLGAEAVALDPARRCVTLAGGEALRYDDLLIATGAGARQLPGLDAQPLRTLADARRLREALACGEPLAVIGAGLIGLEVAAASAELGLEVTVIEAAPRPLPGILGPRAAAWLVALHRAQGVRLRLGTTVARAGDGLLELSDGMRVEAAHVVAGVGVQPATGWLAGSGLDPAGPVVDDAGRTGVARVYAAGDAARRVDPLTGRPAPGGHWEAASRGGAAVAAALLGRPDRSPGPGFFWSDQFGIRLQCAGDPRGAEEHVAHGDLAGREFELDHLRDGRIAAVLLAGRPPSALRAARARLHVNDKPTRSAA